jgi:hypothetical protein
MKWTRYVADIRGLRNALRAYITRTDGKCHFERLCINGRVILK